MSKSKNAAAMGAVARTFGYYERGLDPFRSLQDKKEIRTKKANKSPIPIVVILDENGARTVRRIPRDVSVFTHSIVECDGVTMCIEHGLPASGMLPADVLDGDGVPYEVRVYGLHMTSESIKRLNEDESIREELHLIEADKRPWDDGSKKTQNHHTKPVKKLALGRDVRKMRRQHMREAFML